MIALSEPSRESARWVVPVVLVGPFCELHGDVELCDEDGCPWCFIDEMGRGECEICDVLVPCADLDDDEVEA